MQDQLVGVQQDYFINQHQNHVYSVTHHVRFAFKRHLIVVQLVMHLQIEFQKDQNVHVSLVIMNQIIFVQIAQIQKMLYQVNFINFVVIINKYGIQTHVILVIQDFIQFLENANLSVEIYKLLDMKNAKIIIIFQTIYVIIVNFNVQFIVQRVDESTTLPCPDICGDGIITGMDECEDGNTIQYDGCFNCQYQCQLSCTKCIKGECFECNTGGFFVDPTVQPWRCQERCGDQLIVGQEQCEDGNQVDTDGCKDCKYFCRIGCSSCDYTTNTCLSCELPGFIPEKFYCKNICGDKFVVVDPYGFYKEECNDGNTDDDDGCNNNCRFQCQSPWICKSCINNRCQECAAEYFLSEDQVCIPICGDSKIAISEQCEDIFILPYKGCQNCKAKCQSSCITCDTTGKRYLACRNGYRRIDNLCYSICGDQIVTEDEECDDGNLIFEDGCNQCSYSCPITCSNCHQGVCHDCHEGYSYINYSCVKILKQEHDPRCNSFCLSCSIERQGCLTCQVGFVNINGVCYPNCGDQLVVAGEQCDDGNLIFEDGCINCSYSCSMSCTQCYQGFCMNCPKTSLFYNQQCLELIENIYEKEYNNFQFSQLVITQAFTTTAIQTSRIQMKIIEFEQQVYNQVGQYAEFMNSGFPFINIEINIQCIQNKQVKSHFIKYTYEKEVNNEEILFSYGCHQTLNQDITFSFKLEKIVLKDETSAISHLLKHSQQKQ